jgi:hypothetical protein
MAVIGNGPGLRLYELGPGTPETKIAMSSETTSVYARPITPLVGGNRASLGNILGGNRAKVEQKTTFHMRKCSTN